MAEPIGVASGIIALVTFALKSSVVLHETIRGFQSLEKNARALKGEVNDLAVVLESLLQTVRTNPDIDFEALKVPLHRCGKSCEEYGKLIARYSKHSTESRPSLRDWFKQKYLQGDITEFKDMLAAYKSTINIALANANIRVTAMTPRVLEEYKELIRDTTADLKEHLQSVAERVERLAHGNAGGPASGNTEWQAMVEEKESTQQGLRICAQLSAQVEQFESTSTEHPRFLQRPSAHKYVKNGLSVTKNSIQSLTSRLQSHEEDIDRQMEAMNSTASLSESAATQLAQLQETKDSIQQCIKVVSDADKTLDIERRNIFEDITMADEAYDFSVSTIGDLVTARRINLSGRTRHVAGQISDESYQKSVEALTQLDMGHDERSVQQFKGSLDRSPSIADPEPGSSPASGYIGRYGPGNTLSPSAQGVGVSSDVQL